MLFNLKNRIKKIIEQKVHEIKRHQNHTQQIALDYAQISKLFPESNFIPFTSWSISPTVILHILNDISINKRRNIIEFGSGASTLYIAKLIETLKLDAKFYSVESNEEWFFRMKEQLAVYNLGEIVTLIYAPLKNVENEFNLKDQELWYDTEIISSAIDDTQYMDLIIVDGPYGGSTPYARYSAIPFLQNRLSKNFSIFLDDAHREHEDQIAMEWSKLLNLKSEKFKGYVYFSTNTSFTTSLYKL